jgi:hypothetical protein
VPSAVPPREIPCAASTLALALLDSPPREVVEVARTRISVHYETGHPGLPILCLCTADAVRLPHAVVTAALPPARLVAGSGGLRAAGRGWRVNRWWQPPAPRGLPAPHDVPGASVELSAAALPLHRRPRPTYDGLDPARLVGAGAGLTPAGDDLLAGALVAAHATADPRLSGWRRATRAALATRTTTAVSRGVLHAALDGYATPQLAALIEAVCRGSRVAEATEALLAVGHSSGAARWHGVHHPFCTRLLRKVA